MLWVRSPVKFVQILLLKNRNLYLYLRQNSENLKNIRYSKGALQQTSNCRSPLQTIFLSFHSLEIIESALWILFACLLTEARKTRQRISGGSRQTSNHILRSCDVDNDTKMFFFSSFWHIERVLLEKVTDVSLQQCNLAVTMTRESAVISLPMKESQSCLWNVIKLESQFVLKLYWFTWDGKCVYYSDSYFLCLTETTGETPTLSAVRDIVRDIGKFQHLMNSEHCSLCDQNILSI